MMRVSMSALFCDSDLSAPSQSEVVNNVSYGAGWREPTEVKINFLEKLLASEFGEDMGNR